MSALAFTPPDELLGNSALLESIVIANRLPPGTWGGRHNVKVADLPRPTRKALGRRYVELKDSLTTVKQKAKKAYAISGERGWRKDVLKIFPVLKKHRDLLEAVNPYSIPNDSKGSGAKAPWEIAIEIAAREVIQGYKWNSTCADSLRAAVIIS